MDKKIIIAAIITASIGFGASAQGAIDAFKLSEMELRGTARYLGMGGAFGALGGDLSTLNQNPAGIGVYRSSEIGATLDVDAQRFTMDGTGSAPYTHTQTRAACNNFGYVGAVRTGYDLMPYFQWGATYNRVNSFERYYRGYFPEIHTSWSNYVANLSKGYSTSELLGTPDYDPFFDSNVPWISALAYNTMLINPMSNPTGGTQNYVGLFKDGSTGNAQVEVREKGYVDEYSLNFGGNFQDMVYWGLGLGITDLSYTQWSYYDEQISNALVPNGNDSGLTNGAAEWGIENYQNVNGTGFNVKFGLIFKPVNEFRIGLAVHSPTWYKLNFASNAWVDYGLGQIESDGYYTFDSMVDKNDYANTQEGYWSRKLKSPWRLMGSAAGVIGGRFILSADYVYEAYPAMTVSDGYGVFDEISADVKQYYQAAHELRLGAEFRVTPAFSLRAGYGFKTTAAKEDARNGYDYIYTSGTQSIYEFDGKRQNFSFGMGYRFGQFYVDLAYLHTTKTSQWDAFSPSPRAFGGEAMYELDSTATYGPHAEVVDTHNRFVLTLGCKF
ncbi:MAG: hypothetical protein E7082_02515 [Bacteroidales bacterium]|nr:hypothetical protein [Bacteroidales bacterium]